jgi:hypothetical protein
MVITEFMQSPLVMAVTLVLIALVVAIRHHELHQHHR